LETLRLLNRTIVANEPITSLIVRVNTNTWLTITKKNTIMSQLILGKVFEWSSCYIMSLSSYVVEVLLENVHYVPLETTRRIIQNKGKERIIRKEKLNIL